MQPRTAGQASGIVLAKNDIAKRFGIHTGQVLWEARQQCPELVCVPAHYEQYLTFSAQAREIYTSYTGQVEPFGLDERWLDVTGSVGLFGDRPSIADDIRGRIQRELGLTVSVGVSFNKVFTKLGSDMKKPDATTVITPENYRERVVAENLNSVEVLGHIFSEEAKSKWRRAYENQIQMSGFPIKKPLDDFDFSFQPSIDKRQIDELATMRFLENGENVVFLGPPGVGKAHLASALGLMAEQHRFRNPGPRPASLHCD